jgi:hypothetical protein
MFVCPQCGIIETKSPKKRERKETKLHVLAGHPPCWTAGKLVSATCVGSTTFIDCSSSCKLCDYLFSFFSFTLISCTAGKGRTLQMTQRDGGRLLGGAGEESRGAVQSMEGRGRGSGYGDEVTTRCTKAGAAAPAQQRLSGAVHRGRGRGSDAGAARALGGWAIRSDAPAVWRT